MFAGPSTGQVAVAFPGFEVTGYPNHLEVPSFGRCPGQRCSFQPSQEAVALLLVHRPHGGEVLLGFWGWEVCGKSCLDGGAGGEDVVLVNLPEFGGHCGRCREPADFPARGVKELAKTPGHNRACPQHRMHRGKGCGPAVVHHGSVHFVAHEPGMGASHGVCQCVEHLRSGDMARGIVGAVEDHQPRARADGLRQSLCIHVPTVVQQRNAHDRGMVQFCYRRVQVVTGVLQNHLVPGVQQGGHGGENHA